MGIAPLTRGFGWIAFDGPFSAYDWSLVFVRGDKNARCLYHFERLLDRLEPEVVVMEEPSAKVFRSRRMEALCESFRATLLKRNIGLVHYTRADVFNCFATVGARTNQEIAEAVARQVQGLEHKLPRKRAAWLGEDRRLALFGAAALVITHFHTGGNEFLQHVRDAA